MKLFSFAVILIVLFMVFSSPISVPKKSSNIKPDTTMQKRKQIAQKDSEYVCVKIERSDEEWQKILSPDQYAILRGKGTEMPFTGKYYNNKEAGIYVCAGCGNELFSSDTKFESGTGWPSFFAPVSKENIATERDTSHGMIRTEVLCAVCGAHLGHVFEDGPPPSRLRFCINSGALVFKKKAAQ